MLSNGASPHLRNGSVPNNHNAIPTETPFSLKISNGLSPSNGSSIGQPQIIRPPLPAQQRLDGPRSPPGKQNTAHVPCKFFRQGACQAGKACRFSHDMASTTDNVCKYFAKGNCKFGPKCANIHILPNGQRVNYPKGGSIGVGGGHLNLGGRVNPDAYHGQSSALTSTLYRANMGQSFGPAYGGFSNDETSHALARRTSMELGIPIIDTNWGSVYGSPRDDDVQNRMGLGLSPVPSNGLSVLDAPLPASFDSQGVSWFARTGPVAASVPTKFGLESPPSSVSFAKEGRTSEALKSLHSSAFGDDTRDRFNGVPSSPPAPPAEEYFGKRAMHSNRPSKPKNMSASLPKSGLAIDKDWDADFAFEEDYLPDNLKELLTPQEKARRSSKAGDEEARFTNSGTGTPNDPTSKFGSPSNSSPSRWGPFFMRQQREDEDKASRASAFGHVGSPLRNSTLHPRASPSQRPIGRPLASPGDMSPYLASPPQPNPIEILSHQFQRTMLGRTESAGADPSFYPTASRAASNPISSTNKRSDLDRQVSNSSINAGRFTTPIDEEHGDFLFNMEEDQDRERARDKEKRNSGGWRYAVGGRSPHLGGMAGRMTNGSNGMTRNGNDSGLEVMLGIGR